jgi:hypothetical protein
MSKVVFVVGAGASVDYGFPLGTSLVAEIRDLLYDFVDPHSLREGPLARDLMRPPAGMSDEWPAAARAMHVALSAADSIDQFLYTRRSSPKIIQLGKMAIIERILRKERDSALARIQSPEVHLSHQAVHQVRDTWLGKFFRLVCRDRAPDEMCDAFGGVTFVTFNYDRCIELYLFHGLRLLMHLDEVSTNEILGRLPIFHAYGSLGDLPASGRSSRPVAFGADQVRLGEAAKGIKTFREDGVEKGSDIPAIQEAIAQADRIVFLGFGYHPQNMKLLFPHGPPLSADICGTMRLFEPALSEARKFLFGSATRHHPNFSGNDCASFFDEFGHQLLS